MFFLVCRVGMCKHVTYTTYYIRMQILGVCKHVTYTAYYIRMQIHIVIFFYGIWIVIVLDVSNIHMNTQFWSTNADEYTMSYLEFIHGFSTNHHVVGFCIRQTVHVSRTLDQSGGNNTHDTYLYWFRYEVSFVQCR